LSLVEQEVDELCSDKGRRLPAEKIGSATDKSSRFRGLWYVGEVDLENAGILKGLTSMADAARRKGVALARSQNLRARQE
jgi:hypothetical protein